MAKRSRDDLLLQGERLLEEWGVAGELGVAGYAPLLGRAAAADLAIAHRLGGMGNAETVALLQRLVRETSEKYVRKEVKRALYRLQQRGVDVPEVEVSAPVPVIATSLEGYRSSVDGHGDQLVWLVKRQPGGAAHLYAMINDPEGMREAALNLVTRKALKSIRTELATRHNLQLVEADWHYCDFLMHRAFGWARQRAGRIVGDYPALRAQLIKAPAPEDLPPLILSQVDPAAIESEPDFLSHSVGLLEEKEFRTWLFGADELRPYIEELEGAKDSPLVLNRLQQEDRLRSVIERAVEELFTGDLRPSWVRRLYAMADFLWATGRQERAKQSVAVAAALASGVLAARAIPFCEHLTQASLGSLLQHTLHDEAERAKTSLVLTPQQLRAERQRR